MHVVFLQKIKNLRIGIFFIMHKYITFLLVLSVLCSCADKYSINGLSSGYITDGTMAYIRNLDETDNFGVIDSCEIIHGQFHMDGIIDSVMCVTLNMGSDMFPIVLESGIININISNNNVKIDGTPLNDSLYYFLTRRDSLKILFDDLSRQESSMYLDGYSQEEIMKTLTTETQRLERALDKLETNFILANSNNTLGVMWFLRLCYDARDWYGFATTTPQIDEIYSKAPKSFKKNKMIQEYMRQVNGK